MKNRLFQLLFLEILWICLPLHGQELLEPATLDLLVRLDKAVEHKPDYRRQREKRLTEEKLDAAHLRDKEQQRAYHHIFKEYARFQTDSARVYLEKMASTPPFDADLDNLTRMGHAEIYAVTGSYAEAQKLFQQVSYADLEGRMRLEYFHLSRTLYGWMADFAVHPESKSKLLAITASYRDSILQHEPQGVSRNIVLADSANVNRLPDLALNLSIGDTAVAQPNELPYIYYNMAVAYGLKGDKDQQMRYLAQTALADLHNGTTEYEALPRLAQLCYEVGQIDRAYRYLVCSMDDASFCKARLRTIEVSNIFPIIDRAYKAQEAERSRMTHMLIYGLCSLAFLLFIVVFYLRQQMHRLSTTRKQLAVANEELQKSNRNLLATDKVKEEYIARYLDRCRTYIDTFETFRRALLKRFKAHQMDELYKELKSEETIQREQERFFEEFDNTFLNLYPHFVQEFNALLQPEYQIYPKGGELLTTELRIFALLRLGVTDSQRIAHFLNYSVATIYSYRSKIRNRAICDKNIFEQEVMNIASHHEEIENNQNDEVEQEVER